MPKLSRRLVAAATAVVLATGALPATAGPGPMLIDEHDSSIPAMAYDISSSVYGTVFASDAGSGVFGRVWLLPGAMSTGSAALDLGERSGSRIGPSIVAAQVAVPRAPFLESEPRTVAYCTVGATCPSMSVYTVPDGYEFIGNGGDKALLFYVAGQDLALQSWSGGSITTVPLSFPYGETPTAVGDAAGVLISGSGEITYVTRSTNAVTSLGDGNEAVLTPSYVVWYGVAVGPPAYDQTRIYRVPRGSIGTEPTTVVSLAGAPGFNAIAATDAGVGWLEQNDDGSNRLWTMPWSAAAPVLYPRPIDTTGLSGFQGGPQLLVNDRRAGIPGLYSVALGATTSTLRALLPTRSAITRYLALSHQRAVYSNDTTEDGPVFLRDVPDGVPGAESTVTTTTTSDPTVVAGDVGLSGPFVAYTRHVSATTTDVVYGRVGGPFSVKTFPVQDVGEIQVSGHRVLATAGARSRIIDIVTGAVTDLGRVYAGLFGDYVVTLNHDTGLLQRKHLVTGTVQTIRGPVPGCTTSCIDEEAFQIHAWGHEVVFAFKHGGSSPGTAKGLWNGTTGATTPLPMLTADNWYSLRYWDGLLLAYLTDFTVRLYDLRTGAAPVMVDDFADHPMDLDGRVVAWRSLNDLRARVRDVRDLVPGHVARPRHLGTAAPAGFGPGLSVDAWDPRVFSSQDMSWTMTLRSGSAAGPIVRTFSGTTTYGEVKLPSAWNGTDSGGAALPQGTYHWTLTGASTVPSPSPVPFTNVAGTATSVSGTVFLSRTPPTTRPVLSAPSLASDVSASTTFTVSWSAPPSGVRTLVQRSTNGGAYTTVVSPTSATSHATRGSLGATYRFRAAHVDSAGRLGPWSTEDSTVVPYDERTGRFSASWTSLTGSSHYQSTAKYAGGAGATFSYTAAGTAVYLVGVRGPRYGQLQVSIDGGAYSAAIDTYASATQYRKVLYSRSGLSNTTHTIRVRVVGTSGRPYVVLDGVGFRR